MSINNYIYNINLKIMRSESTSGDYSNSFDSTIGQEFKISKNHSKKLITIGKCSRFYLFILASGLFKLFSLLLLGDNKVFEDGIGLFGFCPILYKYNFMQSIYTYLGYIIFGLIFFYFKGIDNKEKEQKEFENLLRRKSTIRRSYIHNNPLKKITKNTKFRMLLVCLALVIHIEVKKVLYIKGFQFFNFWTLEIVFMILLLKKYFIIDFYIHHKASLIFNISACSTLLLIASFLPSSLSGQNPVNSYVNIKELLGNYFYCLLFIAIFVILSYIYSFSRTYSKVLMQIKFISPYKLIYLFGITGLIITLLAAIIAYFIGYEDNLPNYFSSLRDVLNEGKYYKFYAEVFLVIPLYSFTNFMQLTFEILTIYYLNPFYVLMTNNVYYIISEFITFMLNLSSDGLIITQFLLAQLTEFFAILGYMIYLEIIELNFCGLNQNLRKTIIKKGDEEFKMLSLAQLSGIDIEDEENEDEVNESNNKDLKKIGSYK